MKFKLLSILLTILIVLMPFHIYAGQQDPDDSLNVDGNLLYIGKGEKTPYAGILFDIPAATKLKIDKQFMVLKFKLEIDFMKKKLNAEHSLVLSKLQLKYDTLKTKTDSLLKIKTEEINRLQVLIKEDTKSYSHWWFVGGIIAGCLLSLGIYYAAIEIKN
tara:strand:+ start:23 stop:502 length:480 start_codon:yes stop_codon:yes gene_type:complete